MDCKKLFALSSNLHELEHLAADARLTLRVIENNQLSYARAGVEVDEMLSAYHTANAAEANDILRRYKDALQTYNDAVKAIEEAMP